MALHYCFCRLWYSKMEQVSCISGSKFFDVVAREAFVSPARIHRFLGVETRFQRPATPLPLPRRLLRWRPPESVCCRPHGSLLRTPQRASEHSRPRRPAGRAPVDSFVGELPPFLRLWWFSYHQDQNFVRGTWKKASFHKNSIRNDSTGNSSGRRWYPPILGWNNEMWNHSHRSRVGKRLKILDEGIQPIGSGRNIKTK